MSSEIRNLHIKRTFLVIFILFFLITQSSVSQAAFTVQYSENSVDTNSNVDLVSNIGTQTGSINDAQSFDSSYQSLTEGNSSVGVTILENYVNQTSDIDGSQDVGVITNFANLQATDSIHASISETVPTGEIQVTQTVVETFSGIAGLAHTIDLPIASTNDLRLCVIAGNPDGIGTAGSLTIPSGWVEIGSQTETGAQSTGMLTIIYRIVQGGDGSTVALTYDNNVMVSSICVTYEGVDITTPIDQTTPAFSTGIGNCVSPSINTQTDDAWVGTACLNDGAPFGFSDTSIPSGTTLRGTEVHNPPSNGQNVGFADEIFATASSTGTFTWSNGASEEYVAATFALRPASGSSNYQMDQEFQFIDVIDFLETETLAIKTGDFGGSENINVTYWGGSSWTSIASDLTPNTWNNFTVSLTSTTFTIKLGSSNNTNDNIADWWEIDAVLLVLAGEGSKSLSLDNNSSDVDSSMDAGVMTNFNTLGIRDSVYANVSESQESGGLAFQRASGTTGASHTIDIGIPGNYRLVAVFADIEGTGTSLSGVTVDGKSATKVTGADNSNGAGNHQELWVITETGLGSSTGSITVALGGGNFNWATHVMVFYGVKDSVIPFDSQIDNTALNQIEINPAPVDIPNSGLLIFGAATGGTVAFTDSAWDTSPAVASDDGQSPEIEMTEAHDTAYPNSAILAEAYWISDTVVQTGRQFRASSSPAFNRGTGIIASFEAAPSGDFAVDQEMQFLNLPTNLPNTKLTIHTGDLDSENILVDYWNGTDWVNLFADLTANSWNNLTVTNYLTSDTFTLRLKDGNQVSDVLADSWLIDYIQLEFIVSYTHYRLEWEHQAQIVDLGRENYKLSIYGYSSNVSENFEIQIWNSTSSSWANPLYKSISTTETWYNYTISGNGIIGTSITWRYVGSEDDPFDLEQSTLYIDYAAIVSYDELPEIHNPPANIQYNEGSAGNTINWNISDGNPATYTVEVNTTSNIGPFPWNSYEFITIDIDGLPKGFHNYTIIALDINAHQIVDTVIVQVLDATPPTFVANPSTLIYTEDTTGNTLSWNTTDNYPDRYEVKQNGTLTGQTGAWDNANNITISVDGLSKGFYEFNITVYDESNNAVTSSLVVVQVKDNTNPIFVSEPTDIVYSEGASDNTLTWNSTDLYPDYYEVYQNSTFTGQTTSWDNATSITVNVDGLRVGLYEYYIIIYDKSGNFNTSSIVYVTVNDTTLPELVESTGELTYGENSNGHFIHWNFTDLYPDNYILYLDEGFKESGSWSNATIIEIDVDGLANGNHNYTIVVFDLYNNQINHTIWVYVISESQAPGLIASPANSTIMVSEGIPGSTFNFTAIDELPYRYYVYVDESPRAIGNWANNTVTIINVDDLALAYGSNAIRVEIEDQSQNTINFNFTISVIDTTNPNVVLSDDMLTIIVGSDGEIIEWRFNDLHPGTYEIYDNGSLIQDDAWANFQDLTVDLDGLSLGTYNYTIVVYDTSFNPTAYTTIVYIVFTKTQLPEINLDAEFYQGYSSSVTGTWIDENSNAVTIANFNIYLNGSYQKSGIIINGVVQFDLDYNVPPGFYNLTITFEQFSYQNHTLTYFIKINPHDVIVDIIYDDFIPGQEYTIRVQVIYNDANNNSLTLNSIGAKTGGVANILVTVNMEIEFANGTSRIIQLNGITDSSGIATLSMSGVETKNVESILSIDISTEDDINLLFNIPVISQDQLPTVMTISLEGTTEDGFNPFVFSTEPLNLAIYAFIGLIVLVGLMRVVKSDKQEAFVEILDDNLQTVTHDKNMLFRLSEVHCIKALLIIDYKTRKPVFVLNYSNEDHINDVIAQISSTYTDLDSIDDVNEFILNSMDRSLDEMIVYDFIDIERILGDNIDIYLISHGKVPEFTKSLQDLDTWFNQSFDLNTQQNISDLFTENYDTIVKKLHLTFDTWSLNNLSTTRDLDISKIKDTPIQEVLKLIIEEKDISFTEIVGSLHETQSVNQIYGIIHELYDNYSISSADDDLQITVTQEKPVLFMVIQVLSGGRITSCHFSDKGVNETLLAGLISAIQSMSQSIFESKGVIDNINYDEYTIAFRFQEDIMYSYVFTGPSFTLQKKFDHFLNKIGNLKWLRDISSSIVIQSKKEELKELDNLIKNTFDPNIPE